MKTTRLLAILLSLVMMLALFACNGGNIDNETEAPTDTETDSTPETDPAEDPEKDDISYITIAEALELCGDPGNITEERYYIRATVKSITNAQYGAMIIYDETGEISVYGTYSADGSINYSEMTDKPYKGDEVVLHCILQNYNGTKEVQNARLIEFKSNQGNFDASAYADTTIAEARGAAAGEKIKVSGTVACITYANGMKPSGFILVNGAASIYVYGGDAAAMVSVGNKVTVAGSKAYWILEDEQTHAATYGYKGCNQLEDVTVISNDKGNNAWENSEIPETTVKTLMDKPVSEDFTTQIFKTTALVKKVPGNGFTNYYIDDLDGVIGSYVYTQCNGGDFSWLDVFDGKICTVYFAVLNAKSTQSGCVYRLLPIKVIDEGFKFNTDNAPEYAVTYHGLTQFESSYSGNPSLELVTSVSSELLGFENATLTYSSSNESIIKIETADGKTVMNCLSNGSATVTATASYNGKTYSGSITINVNIPTDETSSISVKDAIESDNGTTVTVKGVVASSVANKPGGFYLIDETGAITVLTDTVTIKTLKIGEEVIIKGTRTLSKDTDRQICIDNAVLIQNNYGSHEYSTNSFITDKTVSDICALNGDISHTVEVYVVTGTIRQESTNWSLNTYVGDGQNEFFLYSGGKSDYAWLTPYVGQTLTIELAVCDWNNKGNKGCVLSITLADGTQIFNTYNFK